MSGRPKWEGTTLRGSLRMWTRDYCFFPPLGIFGLFLDEQGWSVDFPPGNNPKGPFAQVRVQCAPSPLPDLSLSFLITAKPGSHQPASLRVGPFAVPRSKGSAELLLETDEVLMEQHHRVDSDFEMYVICPSRGVQPPSSSHTQAQTDSEPVTIPNLVADIISSPLPFDVRFSFPRSGHDLWANSTILRKASSYFEDMLASGMNESQTVKCTYPGPTTGVASGADGDWSDSDDDAPLPAPAKPGQRVHTITITDHSFTTYRAVVTCIITKQITFAPLRVMSAAVARSNSASSSSQPATKRRKTEPSTKPSTHTPQASSKSVYRLAHLLDLTELKEQALAAFASDLTVDNVAHQLFSSTADLYDVIRTAAAKYAVEHWARVKDTAGMKEVMAKFEGRELDHGGMAMKALAEAALNKSGGA